MQGELVVVAVCGAVCLVIGVLSMVAEFRFRRRMIAEGYVREFVITCSADPGGYEWVKKRPRC